MANSTRVTIPVRFRLFCKQKSVSDKKASLGSPIYYMNLLTNGLWPEKWGGVGEITKRWLDILCMVFHPW